MDKKIAEIHRPVPAVSPLPFPSVPCTFGLPNHTEVTMAIRDWPSAERPREKLLRMGAGTLSDAELLAIFLRTGLPGVSAVDLARRLLNECGGLRPLLDADYQAMRSHKGLGPAKFVQLQAALELARRHL